MFLLLLVTAGAGIITNKFLHSEGVHELYIRYPATVIASYLVFVFTVRIWLSYVRAYSHELPAVIPETPDGASSSGTSLDSTALDLLSGSEDAAGCLIILFLIVICCILGGAAFLIYEAPIILSEAAFEFFLAAGLIVSLQKLESPDWTRSILQTTWKPFIATIVFSFLFGFFADASCPNSSTMKELIFNCAR
jgi:hypothetical protein